jgi:glyoxylate reductase
MPRQKVFVTRKILEPGLQMIRDFCAAEIWPDELPPSHEILQSRVKNVEGLLCLLTDPVDSAILDAAGPGLKVISSYAVGVDNVDLKTATQRGIPVGHTPGILTDATADMAFALLLAAARRVVEGDRLVKAGGWKTWGPAFMLGTDLAGATLGIIGFGRIGQAVAHRAAGFGMRILFTDPGHTFPESDIQGKQVDLETLLRDSDFVSLHVDLNETTRNLINTQTLELMKPTAVLVNTARGAVVDQDALYKALLSKQIFAAALDVTVPEPLPVDSPLLQLENCIVVPHIASASIGSRQRMSQMAAENLIAGLKGERLPFCANPEVYGDS